MRRLRCPVPGDATVAPVAAAWTHGDHWQQLLRDLALWLQRRFAHRIDATNVAGETVLQALVQFGPTPQVPSGKVWRWACRTASNQVFLEFRRRHRCEIVCGFDMDMFTARSRHTASRTRILVAEMLSTTTGVEHEVLAMLLKDGPTNAEMASRIGVDTRTVERARERLRHRYAVLLKTGNHVGSEHL